jgi:hypothetical protein
VRVSLSTSGGLAGALRLGRPPTVVDSGTLPAEAARELAGLVAAARDEGPPPAPVRPAADQAGYTITVEDGGTPTVLERSDTTMTRAFADLLEWIERRGSPPAL